MAILSRNSFGKVSASVAGFVSARFHSIGSFVGSRPCISLGLSCLFLVLCASGLSQLKMDNRFDKLLFPQGTRATKDFDAFLHHFPATPRISSLLLEAKPGKDAVSKPFLQAVLELQEKVEKLSFEGTNFTNLCVPQPGNGHPCFISSVLGAWDYSSARLASDADPLATLNAQGMPREDFDRILGVATFSSSGALTSAEALSIRYFMKSDRQEVDLSYQDLVGDGWEQEFLDLLKCDEPICRDGSCTCGYESSEFVVYARSERSEVDECLAAFAGDAKLGMWSFVVMIVFLACNLGWLMDRVRSRVLLSFGCVLTIIAAGAAGYGVSAWLQFPFSNAHVALPFLVLGIGVDDSFVIMNAFDHTDPSSGVPERMAEALADGGVSIMVTKITTALAFAISASSSLSALASFCVYASLCVLMLLVFQVTMFAPMAALDAHRMTANRVDCCFCLTMPADVSIPAAGKDDRDSNHLCCFSESAHKGGRVGRLLEKCIAPQLVKIPVSLGVALLAAAFCGLCTWQMTLLSVEDTERKWVPDESYLLTQMYKNDVYFGQLGTRINIMTVGGDHFASQAALASIGSRLDTSSYVGTTYMSWAGSFQIACQAGVVAGVHAMDADGHVTNQTQYYAGLKAWLSTVGAQFSQDVVWVDSADPEQGIEATRMAAELKSPKVKVGNRSLPDIVYAVDAMDNIREMCDGWTDLPGGKAIPSSPQFVKVETYKIIMGELVTSVGLCLLAVFFVMLLLLAHPLTALLVVLCVVMTLIEILGCMQLWGLGIDNMSVINVVMSVGLCVDFAAHVAHNFMQQEGAQAERVVRTIGDVGAPVLSGGVSTLLGLMMLAASKSYIFRAFFKIFFLTVTLGLANGLILLPALLNLVGPAPYKVAPSKVEVTK